MIFSTESTAIGARTLLYCATTLLPSDVVAALISAGRSLISSGMDISCKISHALSHARPMASEMTVGCTPRVSSETHLLRSEPHSTVTDVVPSPATMSWDLDSSTSIFAAGWDTSILFKIVAPSLVIVTSLFPLTSILSIPRGPNDVRNRVRELLRGVHVRRPDVVLQLVVAVALARGRPGGATIRGLLPHSDRRARSSLLLAVVEAREIRKMFVSDAPRKLDRARCARVTTSASRGKTAKTSFDRRDARRGGARRCDADGARVLRLGGDRSSRSLHKLFESWAAGVLTASGWGRLDRRS